MVSVELKNTESPETPDVVDHKAEVDGLSQDAAAKMTATNRRPRRKSSGRFRKIPRGPVEDKENKGPRPANGGRQRTTSLSSVTSGRSQRRGGKPGRRRTPSEASAISEAGEASPLRKLRDTVMEKHEKKGLNLLNSYIKNRMELAKFDNTTCFLERCDSLQLVPKKYRLPNLHIKNTKHVIKTLDRYSFSIMFADLKYNRKRRLQVSKLLLEKEKKMQEMFGDELCTEILQVAGEAFERRSHRIHEQQAKIFDSLLKEYGITDEEKAEGEERLKRIRERERIRQERRAQEKEGGDLVKANGGKGNESIPVQEGPLADKNAEDNSAPTAKNVDIVGEVVGKTHQLIQAGETNSEI